jgi:hypothetical protein
MITPHDFHSCIYMYIIIVQFQWLLSSWLRLSVKNAQKNKNKTMIILKRTESIFSQNLWKTQLKTRNPYFIHGISLIPASFLKLAFISISWADERFTWDSQFDWRPLVQSIFYKNLKMWNSYFFSKWSRSCSSKKSNIYDLLHVEY